MADLRTRRTFDRCEPTGTFGLTRKSWRADRVLICLTAVQQGLELVNIIKQGINQRIIKNTLKFVI